MEYTKITAENLEKEHICCAISNNNDIQVSSKKNWIRDRLDDGLVFLKANERGKCFIEYIPAEKAWIPIDAADYMYIDCFWVSGSFKGHGYSNDLLEACKKDSMEKGKKGLCILSSAKKKPFLSDPKYLLYKKFQVADESDAGINLMYLPFSENCEKPHFLESAKHPKVADKGFVLFYTHQCPYNAKYAPVLEEIAKEKGIAFKTVLVKTREEAQKVPSPCTSYALFRDGEFLTNEILSEKKFREML